MAALLKYLFVTCLLMLFVESKPALGRKGKEYYNDLAAQAILDRSSAIEIDPSVMDLFNAIRNRHAHRYAAFKNPNGRRIVIDDNILGDPSNTISAEENEEQFNKMKSLLTNQEPRYILYDFADYRSNRLALILWCSDAVNTSARMRFGNGEHSIVEAFDGVAEVFKSKKLDDLDYTRYKEKMNHLKSFL